MPAYQCEIEEHLSQFMKAIAAVRQIYQEPDQLHVDLWNVWRWLTRQPRIQWTSTMYPVISDIMVDGHFRVAYCHITQVGRLSGLCDFDLGQYTPTIIDKYDTAWVLEKGDLYDLFKIMRVYGRTLDDLVEYADTDAAGRMEVYPLGRLKRAIQQTAKLRRERL